MISGDWPLGYAQRRGDASRSGLSFPLQNGIRQATIPGRASRSGLGAAARLLFRRHVYRSHRFIVTRATLAGPPAAQRVGEIVFRLTTPSDLDRLDELERYGRGDRHRFYVKEDADWLFVACHGDRVVATRRYSRALPGPSKDGHGLTSRVIQLEPDLRAPARLEEDPALTVEGLRGQWYDARHQIRRVPDESR